MNTATLTDAEVLDRAADLITAAGLAKEKLYDPVHGGYCIAGAINMVLSGDYSWLTMNLTDTERSQLLLREVGRTLGLLQDGRAERVVGVSRVIDWNNRSDTTKQQVVDVLHLAAFALPVPRGTVLGVLGPNGAVAWSGNCTLEASIG